jgi:hypothetical protein
MRTNDKDSWHIEYHAKDENELRYQILLMVNEYKLENFNDMYLNKENEIFE